ncbi:hypothetical protein LDH93_01735 [Bifidobacterium pseudolongum]|uniref:hypothetical protein n=1 Tax=Bifidobacterium pseudolongum TaxID=1694 RepID=UPI001CE1B3D9|nr:hypothetical protein [Bifidobacterium pseudolongum]UBZ03394.1 hypothetical protein LDH93_01735 [Bifidobacterium pseudolongum]
MRTPFTMDSAGFLALLDALERRFNEVTAAASLSFAGIDGDLYPVVQPARAGEEDCADRGESAAFAQSAGAEDSAQPEPTAPCPGARCDSALRSPASTPLSCDFHGRTGAFHDETFDPQLVELASSAFGSTCWASLMCVASLGLDAALVECARQFLMHTSIIVRQKGLAVWLYDLINDATMAMLLGQTSARMPVTIRPMSQVQISRWLHGSGVKRFGSQQQRAADRAEYGNQAHRLAAYCMLRWGAPAASSAQIATMLLTNPGIGMCMLREDPNVRAQGACTDTRYRRVVEYLRSLHAQADLDYARALKIGDVPWLSPDGHAAVTIAADRRYLYDANRLVHAYRALWDRATADPAQLLMAVEETRTLPEEPLWENPVYLRDLADSLMGAVLSDDLTVGFQHRDRDRFDRGVRMLEHMGEQVRAMNVLMLPIVAIDECEPDWNAVAARGYKARTMQWRAFCDRCDDLATVVLAQLQGQGDGFHVRAAATLLKQSLPEYCELALPLFEQEIERLAAREHNAADASACGQEREGGAVHVDMAA